MTTSLLNSRSAIMDRLQAVQAARPWPLVILPARTVLFAVWQIVIALILWISGRPDAFSTSSAWWPVTATLTNLVCLSLLAWLAGREGLRLFDLYNFIGWNTAQHRDILKDVLITLGVLVIAGPLVILPNYWLGTTLFGDPMVPFEMFAQPLPLWAILPCLILFPVTIALSELPTYFGYATPRLEVLWNRNWTPVILASFWLSVQHCTLPLILDGRFFFWRFGMFLPFAFLVGLVLKWRSQLLPYMMVVHGLMDFQIVWMVLGMSI